MQTGLPERAQKFWTRAARHQVTITDGSGKQSRSFVCADDHDDPAAPDVGERAIRQTLALLGLVDAAPEPPQGPFEVLRLDTVIDRLHPDDQFVKAWTSFDPLAEGELIARRHDGTEVRAPGPGRIVFPDPGARAGHEWFYLARPSTRPVWAA
jgi:hypothetical protein